MNRAERRRFLRSHPQGAIVVRAMFRHPGVPALRVDAGIVAVFGQLVGGTVAWVWLPEDLSSLRTIAEAEESAFVDASPMLARLPQLETEAIALAIRGRSDWPDRAAIILAETRNRPVLARSRRVKDAAFKAEILAMLR